LEKSILNYDRPINDLLEEWFATSVAKIINIHEGRLLPEAEFKKISF